MRMLSGMLRRGRGLVSADCVILTMLFLIRIIAGGSNIVGNYMIWCQCAFMGGLCFICCMPVRHKSLYNFWVIFSCSYEERACAYTPDLYLFISQGIQVLFSDLDYFWKTQMDSGTFQRKSSLVQQLGCCPETPETLCALPQDFLCTVGPVM